MTTNDLCAVVSYLGARADLHTATFRFSMFDETGSLPLPSYNTSDAVFHHPTHNSVVSGIYPYQ